MCARVLHYCASLLCITNLCNIVVHSVEHVTVSMCTPTHTPIHAPSRHVHIKLFSLSLSLSLSPSPLSYYGLLLWFPEYFKCIHEKQMNCAFDISSPDTCAPSGVTVECNETGSIYIDSLYTSLATIPGTILGIITVNVLGGKVMLG